MRKLNFDLNQPDFARASEITLYEAIKKVAVAHDEMIDQIQWCKDKIAFLEKNKK